MTTSPHTTLLEILSRPVTGDPAESEKHMRTTSSLPVDIKEKTLAGPSISPVDIEKATPADIKAGERIYHEALAYIKDAIAPAMIKVSPNDIQVNDTFCKTLFTYAYPDFLE